VSDVDTSGFTPAEERAASASNERAAEAREAAQRGKLLHFDPPRPVFSGVAQHQLALVECTITVEASGGPVLAILHDTQGKVVGRETWAGLFPQGTLPEPGDVLRASPLIELQLGVGLAADWVVTGGTVASDERFLVAGRQL
jgi:hypothetical protein